jgi:hypothetical protein
MPLAFALLSAAVAPERRGKALGLFSMVTGIAVLGGPLVGGAVTEGLAGSGSSGSTSPSARSSSRSSRGTFPRARGPRAARLPGIALIGAPRPSRHLGLRPRQRGGWGSAEVLATLGGGLALGAGFVAWERRSSTPMLPMRLFAGRAFARQRPRRSSSRLAFSAVFFLAQFLQVALGYGPTAAGLGLMAWTGTTVPGGGDRRAWVDRGAGRPLVIAGLLLQAAGMGAIALLAAPGLAYGWLVAPVRARGLRRVDGHAGVCRPRSSAPCPRPTSARRRAP